MELTRHPSHAAEHGGRSDYCIEAGRYAPYGTVWRAGREYPCIGVRAIQALSVNSLSSHFKDAQRAYIRYESDSASQTCSNSDRRKEDTSGDL